MITEDIDVYFYEFGRTAIYNGSSSIKVITDRVMLEYYTGSSAAQNNTLTALCRTSDLTGLTHNKTLAIGGTTYYIADWDTLDFDNDDLTIVGLSNDQT
jgi:hypothetical protein